MGVVDPNGPVVGVVGVVGVAVPKVRGVGVVGTDGPRGVGVVGPQVPVGWEWTRKARGGSDGCGKPEKSSSLGMVGPKALW